MTTNNQDLVTVRTQVYAEYGELPACDHQEGYMWVVEYFNEAGESIDRTWHMTEAKAKMEAADAIGQTRY